eukprot:762725-Hanusia_phi.AAC.3
MEMMMMLMEMMNGVNDADSDKDDDDCCVGDDGGGDGDGDDESGVNDSVDRDAIKLLTDQRDSLLSELNEIKQVRGLNSSSSAYCSCSFASSSSCARPLTVLQEKSSLLLELQQVKSRSSEFIAQLSSASSLLQDYRLTSQVSPQLVLANTYVALVR